MKPPDGDDPPSPRRLVAAALALELTRQVDLPEAMNAVCGRLGASLRRWIGGDGWHALLRRSLAEAGRVHREVGLSVDDLGRLRGLDGCAITRGGCEGVLTSVVEVLGRLIGPGMALRLIEMGLAEGGDASRSRGAES